MPVGDKSLANLKPFQKGDPRINRGGRPKNTLTSAYVKMLGKPYPGDAAGRTYAEVIAEAVGMKAAKGDERAAKEIEDRVMGRARQTITITDDTRSAVLAQAEGLVEDAAALGQELSLADALQLIGQTDEVAAVLACELASEAEQ